MRSARLVSILSFESTIPVTDQHRDGLPSGEEVAIAIRHVILSRGLAASYVDGSSWSWFFTVSLPDGSISLEVASNQGWAPICWPSWTLLVGKPKPAVLWRRLFRRPTASQMEAFVRLRQTIHEALSSDSRFSNLRWLREDEWLPGSTTRGLSEPV
jgi:hypothetical protein